MRIIIRTSQFFASDFVGASDFLKTIFSGKHWRCFVHESDEDIVTYKNSRVGYLEETEHDQHVFALQAKISWNFH